MSYGWCIRYPDKLILWVLMKKNTKRLDQKPFFIALGIIGSIITLFVFITGKESIPELLQKSTEFEELAQLKSPIATEQSTSARRTTIPSTTPLKTPSVTETRVNSLSNRQITVAVSDAEPPFSPNTITGVEVGWDGFSYDLVIEVCNRLNCSPQFTSIKWEEVFSSIKANVYEWYSFSATITRERAEVCDFSIPYIHVTSGEDLAFMFPKGSDIRPIIDDVLSEMIVDGTIDRLAAKWNIPIVD